MGISCEINLCKPADGLYTYQPGSIISGGIKYHLDEKYEFTSIIVSLKGTGHLYFEDKAKKRRDRMYKYANNDVYVDLKNVIHNNEKGEPLSVGQYETQFSFRLPYNIPASMLYKKDSLGYYAEAYVKYRIRIQFERPGWFKLNKRYEKELNVISGQVPRLTTEPLVYGDQKSLLQLRNLFSSDKGIVNLKATIVNSVLRPGEFVQIDYEITNSTNKTIKDVQVKMVEVDQYTSSGPPKNREVVKIHTLVEGSESFHEGIRGAETGKCTVQIMIPEHCASIDHCNFLSRDYSILTLVRLPYPHLNLPLEIPFQVIKILSSSFEENANFVVDNMHSDDADDPPSYWEAMGEVTMESAENKTSKDDNDDVEEKKDT